MFFYFTHTLRCCLSISFREGQSMFIAMKDIMVKKVKTFNDLIRKHSGASALKFDEKELHPLEQKFLKDCMIFYTNLQNELIRSNSIACQKIEEKFEPITQKISANNPGTQNLGELRIIQNEITDFQSFIKTLIKEQLSLVEGNRYKFKEAITLLNENTEPVYQVNQDYAIKFFSEESDRFKNLIVDGILGSYSRLADENEIFISFLIGHLNNPPKNQDFENILKNVLRASTQLDESMEIARTFFRDTEKKRIDFLATLKP